MGKWGINAELARVEDGFLGYSAISGNDTDVNRGIFAKRDVLSANKMLGRRGCISKKRAQTYGDGCSRITSTCFNGGAVCIFNRRRNTLTTCGELTRRRKSLKQLG